MVVFFLHFLLLEGFSMAEPQSPIPNNNRRMGKLGKRLQKKRDCHPFTENIYFYTSHPKLPEAATLDTELPALFKSLKAVESFSGIAEVCLNKQHVYPCFARPQCESKVFNFPNHIPHPKCPYPGGSKAGLTLQTILPINAW